ncbi:MAG TPA: sarcosine oxidase subunit gamma family protein [Geminicoccaceae bacterium]|nr:sarcosine oxidase subunit gamma family protein [Geminicoccus sp.]HMU50004.1 sarcosine oxidase subunit gamma family protein [Geminicoccaceae bacterium]
MAEPRIVERPVGSVVQIEAWPDTLAAASAVLDRQVGMAPPPGHGAGPLLGLAPGRWLLVAEERGWAARLAGAFGQGQACVTDLSAARVALRLAGPGTLDLLRRHIGIDLHEQAFATGSCAQTQIHHMTVLLHRLGGEQFEIHVGRSFARSLRLWLAH